jgi:single-stranded-DNA-specific exonuclease
MTIPIVRRTVPAHAKALVDGGVPSVLARVYASRGIESIRELDEGLDALPNFASLANIDAAVDRLVHAIDAHERIIIVADYDADGATACAIAMEGLGALGADAHFIVPNRFEFGYGLTPEIVALAATGGTKLIVTVDNGIGSVEGVTAAKARGVDVLVTDHHLPGAALPDAIIVNPNQRGCAFPSKNIAGVGVMFFVLAALRARLRQRGAFAHSPEPNLGALLDVVALGTVADVVRLDHVNRILVGRGLARIRSGRAHPGLQALFKVAGRDIARATTYDLGFVAGPRLNAAGRLADMSLGIRCLLARSVAEAMPLAAELDALNRERREVERAMQGEALNDLDAIGGAAEAFTLCVYRPEWHQGVVGIVASRLKDRFHRPAIVFARGAGGELRGSGRSIGGFHLRDALDLVTKRAPGLVRRFGGHAFAAGLTIDETALATFAALFEDIARESLTPAHLRRSFESDGTLDEAELCFAFAKSLQPCVWGQGFPAPTFDDEFTVVSQRPLADKHLKLSLGRDGQRFEGIAFQQTIPLPGRIRAAYRPEVREWQGFDGLGLIVEHWLPITD